MRTVFVVVVVVLLGGCAGRGKRTRAPGEEYLKKIEIKGNRALSSKTLIAGLALRRTQDRKRAPDPYLVEVDADRIRGHYLREGYLDVDVRPPRRASRRCRDRDLSGRGRRARHHTRVDHRPAARSGTSDREGAGPAQAARRRHVRLREVRAVETGSAACRRGRGLRPREARREGVCRSRAPRSRGVARLHARPEEHVRQGHDHPAFPTSSRMRCAIASSSPRASATRRARSSRRSALSTRSVASRRCRSGRPRPRTPWCRWRSRWPSPRLARWSSAVASGWIPSRTKSAAAPATRSPAGRRRS